jgi:hypothetical protein
MCWVCVPCGSTPFSVIWGNANRPQITSAFLCLYDSRFAGRPLDVKQKLIKTISASWSAITGQPEKQILAGLTEIDSDVSMEYGLILPHPGGETEWFATNKDALDGIQGTGL